MKFPDTYFAIRRGAIYGAVCGAVPVYVSGRDTQFDLFKDDPEYLVISGSGFWGRACALLTIENAKLKREVEQLKLAPRERLWAETQEGVAKSLLKSRDLLWEEIEVLIRLAHAALRLRNQTNILTLPNRIKEVCDAVTAYENWVSEKTSALGGSPLKLKL